MEQSAELEDVPVVAGMIYQKPTLDEKKIMAMLSLAFLESVVQGLPVLSMQALGKHLLNRDDVFRVYRIKEEMKVHITELTTHCLHTTYSKLTE